MKKSLVSIALCIVLAFGGTANAFVPAVIPLIAIAAAMLISDAGLVYMVMTTSDATSHIVDAQGGIHRKSEAQWIDLTKDTPLPLPEIKKQPITANMPFDKALILSEKKDSSGNSLYPLMYSALHKNTAPQVTDLSSSDYAAIEALRVGGLVKAGDLWSGTVSTRSTQNVELAYYKGAFLWDGSPYTNASTNTWACAYYENIDRAKYMRVVLTGSLGSLPPPNYVPKTPAEAVSSLSPDSEHITNPAYQAELDKMFQDPGYVPAFTDDMGLPYAPPPGIPSQAQLQDAVDKYNRQQALNESRDGVKAAQSGAVSAAQGAADAAHAAAQQAAAASAANPGDSGLAYAAAQAAAGAAAADAALAQAKADQARGDNAFTNMSSLASDDRPVSASSDGGTADGLGSLLLSRLRSTGALLASHAPISYLSGIVDAIQSLVADPVAPSMDLPLGFFGSVHISASWFDPLASLTRFFSWLLFILSAAWSFKGYWHRS
ncbi:MAG: hypothetical protein CXR30_01920 [Geobacter sp.]|nr:MAG: hypothetical protein CXR30_01920 [Geobacter sp.]